MENARRDTLSLLREGIDVVHMAVKSSDEFQEPEGWLGEMSEYHSIIDEMVRRFNGVFETSMGAYITVSN